MQKQHFIDWLTVSQRHDTPLDPVGSGKVIVLDTVTGEVIRDRTLPVQHEGSYSTNLLISCDSHTVKIDGNPSRYGRPDNLFGYKTIDECIAVYNKVLKTLGLPGFTKNKKIDHLAGDDGKRAKALGDGALIHRIDVTKNYSVGNGNEDLFLRALSTQTITRRTPELKPNGKTLIYHYTATHGINAGGSRRIYHKVYSKVAELLKFKKTRKFKNLDTKEKIYINRIIRYCEGKGIVREEKEFKGKYLNDRNWQFYGLVEIENFIAELGEVEDVMQKLSITENEFKGISDQLLNAGICKSKQSANSTDLVFTQWSLGKPLIRNTQWYTHKKRLKQLGIDISIPLDISKKLPKLNVGREINVTDAIPPGWYHQASNKPILKLVA